LYIQGVITLDSSSVQHFCKPDHRNSGEAPRKRGITYEKILVQMTC